MNELVHLWFMYVLGLPLDKRFLGLFGLTVPNPADLSGLYNIKVPGDATGYLDISHQQQSAGATGTGYVQHQGQNGPGCKGFNVCNINEFFKSFYNISFSFLIKTKTLEKKKHF